MPKSYWDLIEPYWEVINIYDGPEAFLASYNGAPPIVGLLFAAHFCDSEVCNGGFKQFFMNDTGVLAPEAARGFHAIGQHNVAKIVEDAMGLLGPNYPRGRRQRGERLSAAVLARLRECDDSYYVLKDVDGGGFEAAADSYANSPGPPRT